MLHVEFGWTSVAWVKPISKYKLGTLLGNYLTKFEQTLQSMAILYCLGLISCDSFLKMAITLNYFLNISLKYLQNFTNIFNIS